MRKIYAHLVEQKKYKTKKARLKQQMKPKVIFYDENMEEIKGVVSFTVYSEPEMIDMRSLDKSDLGSGVKWAQDNQGRIKKFVDIEMKLTNLEVVMLPEKPKKAKNRT